MMKYTIVIKEKSHLHILSLLTKGEAASWKEQFVREAIINCKKCNIPLDFSTFTVFETEFFEVFKPFDQTGHTWAEMKKIRFNRPTGNMDEHIARFKPLLTKTGMTDSMAVIDCFRETLPWGLQQKLIMLPDAPTTLTDWYKWAAKIHHGWQVWNCMITRSAGKSPAQKNKNGSRKFNFRPRPDLNAIEWQNQNIWMATYSSKDKLQKTDRKPLDNWLSRCPNLPLNQNTGTNYGQRCLDKAWNKQCMDLL